MPWVEVFTREPLPDHTRAKLAQSLSDTMETVEFGHPTESGRTIDWMWFHTLPANMWAVGGRFDDTYVKGRTMCFARIIAPEALMNTELKHRAINAVAKDLREALGVAPNDDATGIWVVCIEIKERQWLIGDHIAPVSELVDFLNGDVSQKRRNGMRATFEGQAKCKDAFGIPK